MNMLTSKERQQLILEIEKIFKTDNRIYIGEEISYSHLLNYAKKLDEYVIVLLLNNATTKEKFFKLIAGNYNFLFESFERFINSQIIDNSYTSFANRIGLTVDNNFIKDSKDVVLNFPYKDCYLEGGQTTEEGTEIFYTEKDGEFKECKRKRKEIFFNQYIAYDEIDLLLSKKAFTNFKHYKKDSSYEEVKAFNRNEEGVIKDNLVIKGNNLLALHSIKKEFRGKVKLIYIDPPYNTGNDGFKYNDNFNHSTWLVFMKNRLEVARELLRNDGVIFVQCDDNEQAYLKVLMDEIFGRENFINGLIVTMSNMSGPKIQHAYLGKRFPKIKEYVLLYVLSKPNYLLNIPRREKLEWDKEYNHIIPEITKEEYFKFIEHITNNETKLANNIISKHRLITLIEYAKEQNIDIDEKWKFSNMWRIVATKPNESLLKIAKKQNLNLIKEDLFCIESSRGYTSLITTKFNIETETARLVILFAEDKFSTFFGDIWDDIATTGGIAMEGDVSFVKGKKPEKLIKRIIETATKENDIVLDFVSGSGTTAAVAHKMNRQYIAIEQMDYIENITVERLKKVIEGEQGGISKAIDWSGGGDFIYFELAKYNETAIKKIKNAKDLKELKSLFDDLCNNYFLRYNVNIKEFEENDLNSKEFEKFKLDKQKEIFLNLLDPNQMYINFDNMEDSTYKLSEEDKKITRGFYNL